jgi:hypothetical protein
MDEALQYVERALGELVQESVGGTVTLITGRLSTLCIIRIRRRKGWVERALFRVVQCGRWQMPEGD